MEKLCKTGSLKAVRIQEYIGAIYMKRKPLISGKQFTNRGCVLRQHYYGPACYYGAVEKMLLLNTNFYKSSKYIVDFSSYDCRIKST